MTKVIFLETDKGFMMSIKGHAKRDGNEDVNLCCAGLSMMAAAAMEITARLCDEGKLKSLRTINKPGEAYIKAVAYKDHEAELKASGNVIKAGLELLKEYYPGRISMRGEIKK